MFWHDKTRFWIIISMFLIITSVPGYGQDISQASPLKYRDLALEQPLEIQQAAAGYFLVEVETPVQESTYNSISRRTFIDYETLCNR